MSLCRMSASPECRRSTMNVLTSCAFCRFSLIQIRNEQLRGVTVPHIWLGGSAETAGPKVRAVDLCDRSRI